MYIKMENYFSYVTWGSYVLHVILLPIFCNLLSFLIFIYFLILSQLSNYHCGKISEKQYHFDNVC